MAIPLNEEIREEARKMSEFVVEDTKRTVEMLNWLKGQTKESTVVADALKVGAAVATGNIMEGVKVITDTIMPRLRDRITQPIIEMPSVPNMAALEGVKQANQKVLRLRSLITDESLNSHDIDDICYDIQVILAEVEKVL